MHTDGIENITSSANAGGNESFNYNIVYMFYFSAHPAMRHFKPRPLPTWSPGGDEEEEDLEEGDNEDEDIIDEDEEYDNETISSWEDGDEGSDISLLNDTSRATTPEERLLR